MSEITELDVLEANARRDNCNGSVRSDRPKPVLVDRCLQEELVALIPRLERYARVLARDVIAADDLVQDCIARALEKVHLWEPGTDLRAWLFTILYRQYISHARRGARHRESIELQESDAGLALSPNQTVRLELRDLARALARLPEEQRSVVLLVGLEGMDYAEAAAVVHAPVGTVRSRVARGRESLRKVTGLFPARHSRPTRMAARLVSQRRSRRREQGFLPIRTGSSPVPKSSEVVQ